MNQKNKTLSILLFFIIFLAQIGHSQESQQSGSLVGRVSDIKDDRALAFVQVFIQSILVGDDTGENGKFEIKNIKPGLHVVSVKLIGYETIQKEIQINSGEKKEINFQMTAAPYHVHDIQITASRHAVLEQDVPQLVSVLTRDDIRDLNANQTPELLREEIGIYMQKTNQGGGSPIIRGLRANKVLLVIDGIRLNNSTYRGGNLQYLNTIDPKSIERIETVHGPVSALYGSDALGGVINIITKKPILHSKQVQFWDGFASASASTADHSQTAHFGLLTANALWGFLLDASFTSHGNITRGTNGGSTLLHRLQNDSRVSRVLNKTQAPNDYDKYDLMTKAHLSLNDSHHFLLSYQMNRQNNVPRYDAIESQKNLLWVYDPQERDLLYLKYDNKIRNKFFNTANLTLSLNRQLERRIQQKNGTDQQTRDQFETLTYSLQMQMNKILTKNHFLVYGSEFYFDQIEANSLNINLATGVKTNRTPLYPDGSTHMSFGLFGQTEFTLTNRMHVNLGARYSAFKLKAPFDKNQETARFGTMNLSPSAFTLSFGSNYAITDKVKFVTNIAQGFRAPNLDDVSKLGVGKGGNIYDVPNAKVQAEKVLSFDGGFKIASENTKIEIIAYYNSITDLLLRQPTTFNGLPYVVEGTDTLSVFHKTNAGEAYTTGIEFGIEAALSQNILFKTNASYTYGKNISFSEPLSAIPPMNGVMALRWREKQRWFELNTRFAIAQNRLSSEDHLDLRIPEGGTPGWVTFNFRSGFEINDKLSLRFSILNLLDRNYREHMSGFNAPGRNFVLSGEVGF